MISKLGKQKMLYLMLLPCVIYLIIFSYAPMYGIVLAFKDFNIMKGIMNSPWAGLKHFNALFADSYFQTVTWNTLKISLMRLLFGFPIPIILALLLNEVRITLFKRMIQTVIYLPHFISWVIIAGILKVFLTTDGGVVNQIVEFFGFDAIPFLTSNTYFVPMLIVSDILKEAGWGTIIYLAALAGVDPEQYEAAMIDGANRWKRLIHITLPGISIAISIMLILSLSGILNAGFDQIFNLYSPLVYESADIIDTYVFRIGLLSGKYSLATALGLFKSVIALILIVITNQIAKKLGGSGIW
ncbi:putative multiple-sugar transport system permease YteP [Paenibacillus baekrokdamisoli]|uniref:Putative multiple-sugar transport system permease YteP n=1 Tax=Paenibacillus baekrokdamisoli TaxID=1712516 RepID=A0A3G9J8R1_9BACL|nr:ABC transporter permease subunit [Paenibacillus baekrokdamisoli]MBB3067384.1 putative aldouronate transport system permease protein [Paenibacillus baekrokdamisoli]BBH19429.1 putative multiple-sugar transport system permease YteP [Paenibacillus baekrokdamisoli]